jgi:outer membrane protein TolC
MVPLFTGGELAAKIGAAVALARAGESGYSTQTLATLESVTEAYVGTLLADAQVKSAQSRLDAEDEQVRISRAKVAGGSLAPVDLLREQAEEADARSELTEDQASADVAMVALKADLGVSQSSDIVLTDTLDSLASGATARMPSTLAAAMASADSSRPEIAAATARLKSVQSDLNAARGEYAPQVYGVGMADETSGKGLRGTAGYTVGLTASIPLYDGGARKADVDQAKAALDRANLDVELARQSVEQDVAQAWYELQSGQQQVSSAEAGVAAAEQGYSLADLRYSAGKSTTAERLDALAAQTRAQSDLAQAQAGLIVARSRLMAAMGLGLVSNGQ